MRWIYTAAAVLTGLAALAMSWWSIFSVGRYLGIPIVLAAGLSSVFDLAAIVLVGLSQRYASAPHAGSGAGPRLALILMLAGSVFLNIRHAELSGAGATGMVAYAAPAVVAVLLVELHLRFANHQTRHQLGRVAPALPVLGGWAVLLYPGRSLGVIRAVVRARLDAITAEIHPPPVRVTAEVVPTKSDPSDCRGRDCGRDECDTCTGTHEIYKRLDEPTPPAPPQPVVPPAPPPAPPVQTAPARAPGSDPFAVARAGGVETTGAIRVVTVDPSGQPGT